MYKAKNISDNLDKYYIYGTHILLVINGGLICEFDITLPHTSYDINGKSVTLSIESIVCMHIDVRKLCW